MLALEPDFLVATEPLFADELVGAISLSIDFAWMRTMPDWATAIVAEYAAAGALYGHAIHFSPFTAAASVHQDRWLDDFRAAQRLGHVPPLGLLSAHFGLGLVPGYRRGAPLPAMRSRASLDVGRRELARLAAAGPFGVGLENLAVAFSPEDCLEQGPFFEELLAEVDGFVTLDVHNVYCQARNFGLDPHALLATYPLARVRELHVSGGSVGRSPAEPTRDVRQDTHDDEIPAEVFGLAAWVVARSPALEAVFFERLGGTIGADPVAHGRVRADYVRLLAAVGTATPAPASKPGPFRGPPIDDTQDGLAAYQSTLVDTLATVADPAAMKARLLAEAPVAYRERLARSELRMLDLGARIVREWFRRDPS
jgi:hypothetical protein